MTKQQIIEYVMETPGNTNPAILNQFLDEMGGVESNEGKYPVVYANEGDGIINIEYYDPDGVIIFPEAPSGADFWQWEHLYDDNWHYFEQYEGDTLAVSAISDTPYTHEGIIFKGAQEPEGS